MLKDEVRAGEAYEARREQQFMHTEGEEQEGRTTIDLSSWTALPSLSSESLIILCDSSRIRL